MRLRSFRAATMAEAMAAVRAALGTEAVILGSRRVAGGVEVTAALEPMPPASPASVRPLSPNAFPRVAPMAPTREPCPLPPTDPALIMPWTCTDPHPATAWGSEEPQLIPPSRGVGPGAGMPAPDGALARHNLPAPLAAALAATAFDAGSLGTRLSAVLAFGALPAGAPRPVLLAGPPGAGKTLSCVKLAARLLWSGTPPLVVSTDNARAGATAQIAAYTQLMGLMLAVADTPAALVRAREHASPGQPILIDTAGCDPFEPSEARTLLALCRAVEADLVLVLPAGLDPAEATELARGFSLLGATHLVPTRLDQARRLGGVLAAAQAAGLILSDAGTGASVADGLTALTPDWLAARLLGHAGPGAAKAA